MLHDDPSIDALRRRLELYETSDLSLRGEIKTLERSLRRAWITSAVCALLVLLAPIVFLVSPISLERLAARRVTVRDETGRVRIGLVAEGPSASITLYDQDGKEQVALVATPEENALRFAERTAPQHGLVLRSSEQGSEVALRRGDQKASLRVGEAGGRLELGDERSGAVLDGVDGALRLQDVRGQAELRTDKLTLSTIELVRAEISVQGDESRVWLRGGPPHREMTDASERPTLDLRATKAGSRVVFHGREGREATVTDAGFRLEERCGTLTADVARTRFEPAPAGTPMCPVRPQ